MLVQAHTSSMYNVAIDIIPHGTISMMLHPIIIIANVVIADILLRFLLTLHHQRLSGVIRELQRQRKCLLIEMDDLHYQLKVLSEQRESQQLLEIKIEPKSGMATGST